MQNILVYLVYSSAIHANEAIFSILSAARFPDYRPSAHKVVVYTDLPQMFSHLPVTIAFLDRQTLETWAGKDGYVHRRKIMAFTHALATYKSTSVLIDSDTFFTQPPDQLFAMIRPGQAVMDMLEGPAVPAIADAMRDLPAGSPPAPTSAEFTMWNSGIIGLHPNDAGVLRKVVELNDLLYARTGQFNVEQFAFGTCLEQLGGITESSEKVYHYCHPELKRRFRESFSRFMKDCGHFPWQEQAERCYAYRPSWGMYSATTIRIKRCLKAMHLLKRRIRFDLT